MSKPSHDILKILEQYQSQESALNPRRSRLLPPLRAEGLAPTRAGVFSPLPIDLAELAEQADARAERIYNEKINIIPTSRLREEATTIPVTPNSSPLEPLPRSVTGGCFTAWDNKTIRRSAARPLSSTPQSRVIPNSIAKPGPRSISTTLSGLLIDSSHPQKIPSQDQTQLTSALPTTIRRRC